MERQDRVARKQTVKLTHYGRESGKAYEVTIWFVVDGERVYLGQRTSIAKEEFGEEPLRVTARKQKKESAAKILDAILSDVWQVSRGRQAHDMKPDRS